MAKSLAVRDFRLDTIKTVMILGIVSAFCVRIPVAYIMSRQVPVSMFKIGLATPASSVVQIIMCLICLVYVKKTYFKR